MITEGLGTGEIGEFLPKRLIHSNLVQQPGEIVSIFTCIDHLWRSFINVNILSIKWKRNVIRSLTAHRYYHARRPFKVADIEDCLKADVVEVESISLVIVRANRLRVIVDHYSLKPLIP